MKAILSIVIYLFIFLQFNFSQISGVVFRDYNLNGIKDSSSTYQDIPVIGATIRLYGKNGLIGISLSDSKGHYIFNTNSLPPFRVELLIDKTLDFETSLNISSGGSKSNIRFVNHQSNQVNFGINYPKDFNENAQLVTPCYISGDALSPSSNFANLETMVSWNIANGGTNTADAKTLNHGGNAPNVTVISKAKEIGSCWGLAIQKQSQKLYTTATLKRHIGLGPLGIGGFYQIDLSTQTVLSQFDLNTIGIPSGAVPTNADRGLSSALVPKSKDSLAFSMVGKVGFGAMDITENEKTIYLVNLYNGKLYSIFINSPYIQPTNAQVDSFVIPDPICSGGILRPWAVKVFRGKVYVGVVCDAQSTQNSAELTATVYELNPISKSFTQVLQFPLDYPGFSGTSRFKPWIDTWDINCLQGPNIYCTYPQAILTGIDFDGDDVMLLGICDRYGIQGGYHQPNTNGSGSFSVIAYGDILRARKQNGSATFNLENNANDGSIETAGKNTGIGPGFGEYYHGDFSMFQDGSINETESATGALVNYPSNKNLIITSQDPVDLYSSGIVHMNNNLGIWTKRYEIIPADVTTLIGKSSGLGDIKINSSVAPIEIGNLVWKDLNNNGIQDPIEPPLSGVEIFLLKNGNPVAKSISNSKGQYLFSNQAQPAFNLEPQTYIYGVNDLHAEDNYSLRIYTNQNSLLNLIPSPYQSAFPSNKLIDNNGQSTVPGQLDYEYHTGINGQNDFSYDFGFFPSGTCLLELGSLGVSPCNPLTNSFDLRVEFKATNAPIGNVIIELSTGEKANHFIENDGSYIFKFQNIESKGIKNVRILLSLENQLDCFTEHINAFDQPESCCSLNYELCSNRNKQINLFAIPGMAQYRWYKTSGNQILGYTDVLVIDNLSSGLEDNFESYYFVAIDSTGDTVRQYCAYNVSIVQCCGLTINTVLQTDCNNNGTPYNSSDDWFAVLVDASNTDAGISSKYEIVKNNIVLEDSPYGSPLLVGSSVGPDFKSDNASIYNIVIRDFDDHTCADSILTTVSSCPAPKLSLDKTVVSYSIQSDASYMIQYKIEVDNKGSETGLYSLQDLPGFDDDAKIKSAFYTSNIPSKTGAALIGSGPWNITTNQFIPANTKYTYNLFVNFSMDFKLTSTGNNIYTPCSFPPKVGEGLFNRALLDSDSDGIYDIADTACAVIPIFDLDKQLINTQFIDLRNATLTYRIVVRNLGDTLGYYNLIENPSFDDDIRINSIQYEVNHSAFSPLNLPKPVNGWIIVSQRKLNFNMVDTFIIEMNVNIDLRPGSIGDNIYRSCGSTSPGLPRVNDGLFNLAGLDLNNDLRPEIKDTSCNDLPSIAHEKILWTKKIQGVDKNQLVYLFLVKNSGGATGEYTLLDQLTYDNDIIIPNANYTINSGLPQSINGLLPNSLVKIVQNRIIPAFSTDSIFLTLDLHLNLSKFSTGDHTYFACKKDSLGSFISGFGLLNESQLDINKDLVIDQRDTICTDFEYFDLALRKSALNVNTIKIGTNIFFRNTVFNQGTGLARKIEVTDYLTSTFDFDPTLNPGWTKVNDSILIYTIDSIASLDSVFIDLVLALKQYDDIKKTINIAEISDFLNSAYAKVYDIDSDDDQLKTNDNSVIPESIEDGNIQGKAKLNPNEDEDDQDVAQVPIFDIALKKRIDIPAPYNYGQIIPFLITLYNQGHLTIYSSTIVDYVPKGYEIDPVLNKDWVFNNYEGRLLINGTILEGDSLNRYIYLKLLPVVNPSDWINRAEVLNASISKRLGVHSLISDIDSDFDNDPNNDMGGKVNTSTDDTIDDDSKDSDGDGIKDEDDHDPAVPFIWDLALKKIIASKTPHLPGQKLDFIIRVFNQGTDTLGQVGLVDHIPNGLQFFGLDNPDWTINGSEATGFFNRKVAPGDSTDIHIFLILKAGSRPTLEWINYAEILSSKNFEGINRTGFDIDSKEASDNTKERLVIPNSLHDDDIYSQDLLGEEDDHDPAMPMILDLALMKYIKSSNIVKYEDTVTFCIDIFNQGQISVSQISLVDYIPLGMSWLPNSGWVNVPMKRYSTLTIDTLLNPGDSIVLNLKLKVNPQSSSNMDLVNYAEITSVRDTLMFLYNRDIDSQFDLDKFNDAGGVPNSLSDNYITDDGLDSDGNGIKDEDDQDPAMLSLIDFALKKELSKTSRGAVGDTVEFLITVYNQGNIETGSITIEDYLTTAYQFVPALNPGWVLAAGRLTSKNNINLKAGDNTTFSLKLKVLTDNNPNNYCNYAEITSITNIAGQEIAYYDADSKPHSDSPSERNVKPESKEDNNIFGGGPSKNEDEDDHDVAGIGRRAKLGDMVWNDSNANGVMDIGEKGIPNVQVQLYELNTLKQVKITYTNTNGKYLFEDIIPGKYFVKFIPPAGCDISTPDQTLDSLDSDITSTFGYGTTNIIMLSPGDEDRTWDAGLYKCSYIDGYIWYDINHDGIQGIDENGINGIEVFLYSYPNKKLQSRMLTYSNNTRFIHDGYYRFCVKPGTYYIGVQPLKDFVNSPFQQGSNRNLDSDLNDDFGPFTTYKFTGLAGDSSKYINGGIYNPLFTLQLDHNQFGDQLQSREQNKIFLIGNLKDQNVDLHFETQENKCLVFYQVIKVVDEILPAIPISTRFTVQSEKENCRYHETDSLNNTFNKLKYQIIGYDEHYNKLKSNILELEIPMDGQVDIIPNPVEHCADIILQGKTIEHSILEVRDVNGKLVLKEFLKNVNSYKINTSIFPSGIYSVVWYTGNNSLYKKMYVVH